jgi:hypothetical protein
MSGFMKATPEMALYCMDVLYHKLHRNNSPIAIPPSITNDPAYVICHFSIISALYIFFNVEFAAVWAKRNSRQTPAFRLRRH